MSEKYLVPFFAGAGVAYVVKESKILQNQTFYVLQYLAISRPVVFYIGGGLAGMLIYRFTAGRMA